MNIQDLNTLLDYHYWARDRMLDAVAPLTPEQYTKELGNSFKSVRDTAVHIYQAEWVWHSRWMGTSPKSFQPVDQFPDVATLRSAWAELEGKMREFLEAQDKAGLDQEFEYSLMNGATSRSVFSHMLQHVVNHATYHRGQVTTLLRQLGAAPPKGQDMIVFYREKALQDQLGG